MPIAKVVSKSPIEEQSNDFQYWQSQPYDVRLAALDQIRREYHLWKYGTEPRLQSVFSIVKQQVVDTTKIDY